ncbi:ester cyclase [Rhizobium sp. BK456]|uniref:ester cyclase n=1 Tax=Rhizobium sp. BK456 TaxID=2587007 RepID=UPI00161D55D8|nr:ester cyclase [Rhizobium sp. BK456]MBB3522448.1 putative ester cyclase [Rhizobium sp. BK456]
MTIDTTASALTAGQHATLQTFYGAFTRKNPDLLDEAVTPGWQDIPLAPGQGPGPAGLKPIILGFIDSLPDVEILVDEVIGLNDRAGVRARIVGTQRGALFGIPPTNRRIEIPLHEFHRFEGDRISHTWHLEDWFGMLHQLGAWPPKTMPLLQERA